MASLDRDGPRSLLAGIRKANWAKGTNQAEPGRGAAVLRCAGKLYTYRKRIEIHVRKRGCVAGLREGGEVAAIDYANEQAKTNRSKGKKKTKTKTGSVNSFADLLGQKWFAQRMVTLGCAKEAALLSKNPAAIETLLAMYRDPLEKRWEELLKIGVDAAYMKDIILQRNAEFTDSAGEVCDCIQTENPTQCDSCKLHAIHRLDRALRTPDIVRTPGSDRVPGILQIKDAGHSSANG
jgi:hypothetical protein